jgi:pimeloyl-ACP methyl ester carboxylesterase
VARSTTLVLLPGLDGTGIFLRPLLRALPGWTLAKRARAILGVDARARLQRCRAPVLYVAATRDTVVPHHNVEEIVRELPTTSVAHLEGEHLALDSDPEAAARVLTSWIEEVEGRVPFDRR